MKKILLSLIGVATIFSGSLATFAEQSVADVDPSTAVVNYLNTNDHPSAVVRYIKSDAATAGVGYIKMDHPSAVVHFNEEKAIKTRKMKNKNRDEVESSSAVDVVVSGSAVE